MTNKQLKVLNRMHGLRGKPLNCFIHNGNTYCVCDHYVVILYGENKDLIEQYPLHAQDYPQIISNFMAGLKDCHAMTLPPEKEIREWCKAHSVTRTTTKAPLKVQDRFGRVFGFNPWYIIDAYDALKIGKVAVTIYVNTAKDPVFFMSDEGLFMLIPVRISNPFRWNYGPDGWEE
jgi:hypothetical protein